MVTGQLPREWECQPIFLLPVQMSTCAVSLREAISSVKKPAIRKPSQLFCGDYVSFSKLPLFRIAKDQGLDNEGQKIVNSFRLSC